MEEKRIESMKCLEKEMEKYSEDLLRINSSYMNDFFGCYAASRKNMELAHEKEIHHLEKVLLVLNTVYLALKKSQLTLEDFCVNNIPFYAAAALEDSGLALVELDHGFTILFL